MGFLKWTGKWVLSVFTLRPGASTLRFWSPPILSALLGLFAWLWPDISVSDYTPGAVLVIASAVTGVHLAYIGIQGYPISHGDIGTASSHTLDSIVSGFPAGVAVFVIVLHFLGFWPVSHLVMYIAWWTLAWAAYDLWINGGAATKINRLTDEIKSER